MKLLDWIGSIRLKTWYVVAAASSALLLLLFPHQAGTLLWKFNVLSLSLLAAYWADRTCFPYSRPQANPENWQRDAVYQIRRVIIMAAVVISVGCIV